MFGYISIDKPELKIKDYNTFKAYYCGLCKELKRDYKEASRLLITYDCALLYLLCSALTEDKPDYIMKRCPKSPVKKICYAADVGKEYAAAVNILLFYNKLKDDETDSKSIVARAGKSFFKKDYEKAKEKFPAVEEDIREKLSELAALESGKEENIDRPADAFAKLLGSVFSHIDEGNKALPILGYNVGRWLYLADAFYDLESDAKKGNYNPFIVKFGAEAKEEIKESARFNLNYSLHQAELAYDLLDIKKHKAILDNIFYLGLYKKTERLLEGKDKTLNGSL